MALPGGMISVVVKGDDDAGRIIKNYDCYAGGKHGGVESTVSQPFRVTHSIPLGQRLTGITPQFDSR